MVDSHFFLKMIGLENDIGHGKNFCDTLTRDEMVNLDYESLPYSKNEESGDKCRVDPVKTDNICEKQDGIADEVSQITGTVEADDFFSSLELQSSSKMPSSMLSLTFPNKVSTGIVTRSRSFSSTSHETQKSTDQKLETKLEPKRKSKGIKKMRKTDHVAGKGEKNRRANSKNKRKVMKKGHESKKGKPEESKQFGIIDNKKHSCLKTFENILGMERNKDEYDWTLFNNLGLKKEVDEKVFEGKQNTELNQGTRRNTPELFSMSPILMSDSMSEGKDDVDKLLEVDDYDDAFLEEMDEFSNAPPRSHTGGKWKPGSLSVRTSPMLWQSQNWENLLDDRQYEDGKSRVEMLMDSPVENRDGKYAVVASGGKWKPQASQTPPVNHTGGKWKPTEMPQRTKKPELRFLMDDSERMWKCESQARNGPPVSHTGGKWKPNLGSPSPSYRESKNRVPPPGHTRGKWISESGKTSLQRCTLDLLANCQSTSGKCLKTAGGMIQYYCSPCNRRLSSKKMYKNHLQSELHLKRVLQENDLEFDSRSLKLFRGLFTQTSRKERGLGKRAVKRPETYKESNLENLKKERKMMLSVKVKGKRVSRREIIRCEVCRIKIPSYQLGKHLVSYYHSRRVRLNDPEQRDLILNNIHAIVKQAPYQCGICKFYCNSHALFKKHWALPVHKEAERPGTQRFWCALCSFECDTSRSLELHLDSNSHREVIQAVNKSIPIIIRHKFIFSCSICFKEVRFNRELIRHKRLLHKEVEESSVQKFTCSSCQVNCKSMKSLQRHIIQSHKGAMEVPYFCNTCNEFFPTMKDAQNHRNSQIHKYKKLSLENKHSVKTLEKSCSFCDEVLKDLDKLKDHLFEKHRSLLPKCMKCGKVFALSQEVSRHVKNNECTFVSKTTEPVLPGTFGCDLCAFATTLKSELLLHKAIHEMGGKGDRKITCPLCGSQFTQSALSIHLRSHLKEMTYQCSSCSSAFVRKDRFVAHMKSKHFQKGISGMAGQSVIGEELPFEKKRESEDDAKMEKSGKEHPKARDSAERRSVCGVAKCKYVPKDMKDMETHNLVHVGTKVYQCPECSYFAKTNTIIKRHYLIHLNEKSFACPYCPFKGRLKSHLKRHLRLHTGAKPYKCPHCSYSCNIMENLRKHVLNTKAHPGKKLYECKMCDYGTNVSKDFKSHLIDNHKCQPSLAIEAAGIYSKEEDIACTVSPIPAKRKATPKQVSQSTSNSVEMKKKIEIITEKYTPIAPKVPFSNKNRKLETTSVKAAKNSIEDKRKILEMELLKLRKQIKPQATKTPRSYPSPAEKSFKMGKLDVGHEDYENEVGMEKSLATECDAVVADKDNAAVAENVSPISCEETSYKDTALLMEDGKTSPAYVLYENVLPLKDMEMYLLEEYEV